MIILIDNRFEHLEISTVHVDRLYIYIKLYQILTKLHVQTFDIDYKKNDFC